MSGYVLDTNDQARIKIIQALSALSAASESFESVANGIKDHDETFYLKPKDKTYANMAEIAIAAAKEEQEIITPIRVFPYRPFDGAHATAKVLFDTWGYAGFGKTIPATLFSPERPPERRTINVGPNETLEVPWGWLAVPDLKATLKLGAIEDPEKGVLFRLTVECPKLMEKAVKGLFILIEEELHKNSIYRGKAITASPEPEFIDLSRVKPEEVVFKHEVQEALEHEVWFAIEHMDLMRADNQPTRWVTLMAGKFGTGKTLAGLLTAQRCVKPENRITFIQVRPKDNLKLAMETATLYAPAVVMFEDIDTVSDPEKQTPVEISELLETFDGVRSKGVDVQIILTTNHPDKMYAGMVRAGRLNSYIVYGDLDVDALYQLLKVKVGEHRLVDIEIDKVYEACRDYEPAFMDLVIHKARRYALSRNTMNIEKALHHKVSSVEEVNRARDYRISTIDLGLAAKNLRPQWELMQEITKKGVKDDFKRLWIEMVREAMHGMPLADYDGDSYSFLQNNPERIAQAQQVVVKR